MYQFSSLEVYPITHFYIKNEEESYNLTKKKESYKKKNPKATPHPHPAQ